jgi:HYDIN/CFA65/VesB family protein/ASPM-SPD-2-Hydin domain-containing protein
VLLQDNGTVVSLSASQLTFPTEVVGTVSAAMNVVMTNNGSASIAISNIGTTANFSSTNNCGRNLAKGGRCTIKVYFTPSTEGNLTGVLTVFDNGGGSPQTVSLTGVATVLSIVPGSLNFGTQKVHTSSAPQIVTVTNTGSTRVLFTGITVTGRNASDFSEVNACGPLAAGTSCQISVTFTPRAAGARSASVSINDNGGGSPQKVTLSGTGD